MKFTFVAHWHISERGGGAEVQVNYLSLELVKRGYEVDYICRTTNPQRIGTMETRNGIRIFWMPPGLGISRERRAVATELALSHPDFIIHRLSSPGQMWGIADYLKKNEGKFIWICTDNESCNRNLFRGKFRRHYGVVKNLLVYLRNAVYDRVRNRSMKSVSLAFTQNDFQQAQVQRNFHLNSARMISGHPMPRDVVSVADRFRYQTLLWCANLGEHKRPECFIELARKLESHPQIRLVMVGGSADTTYVNRLLNHAPPNLHYLGKMEFEKALTEFDRASLVINTSVAEGFSNTYIQGWLRGVPTLVLGADPDHVIAGNRLGFDCTDVAQMEQRVLELLENRELYCEFSVQCLQYAMTHHTLDILTENFLTEILQANHVAEGSSRS